MTATPIARLVPPLKWAGGKRWLCHRHSELIPEKYGTYFEPFLGGAAMFFLLRPEKSVLSDANGDLISTYNGLKNNYSSIQELLSEHATKHSDVHYYETRSQKPSDPDELAAWFLYLNRSCFNGLYRVNKKGEFNVPKGTKEKIIFEYDKFSDVSMILSGATLETRDFEETINLANCGDFIYVDPPYTVRHNSNGFLKYNEDIFSWEDQERLATAIGRAAHRGSKILVSNADHISVRDLYKDLGETITLERYSVIGGGVGYRSGTTEIAVRINY